MKDKINFSVVIPTYNRKDKIVRCLNSVYANDSSCAEIIVVDDGSTDGTREAVCQLFPSARYVYQQNKGVSAARNTGIRLAQGKFIAFLDSDDTWYPSKISNYASALEKLPDDVGLIFNDMDRMDITGIGNGKSYFSEYFGVDIAKKISALSEREIYKVDGKDCLVMYGRFFSTLVQGNLISPPCTVIKKSVIDRIGLFREELSVAEDSEFFLRVSRHYKIAFIPFILTSIEPPQYNSLSSPKNNKQKIKNNIKYISEFINHYPDERCKKILDHRLINLYCLLGYHYLTEYNTTEAKNCYLIVIRKGGLNGRAYMFLIVAHLPVIFIKGMYMLKKIMKKFISGISCSQLKKQ